MAPGNEESGFYALFEKLKKAANYYDKAISLNHRSQVQRELMQKEELFLTLCMSDALGIPNPAAYYTLELIPWLIEDFHEWHKQQGFDKSPLDTIRCC